MARSCISEDIGTPNTRISPVVFVGVVCIGSEDATGLLLRKEATRSLESVQHTHPSDPVLAGVSKFRATLKGTVQETTEPPSAICTAALRNLRDSARAPVSAEETSRGTYVAVAAPRIHQHQQVSSVLSLMERGRPLEDHLRSSVWSVTMGENLALGQLSSQQHNACGYYPKVAPS